MESFYTIIYYKTNALTDEMISVGILAGGGEGPFIYFSKSRLDLLKKILHPNTFLSVKRHFKALSEKVNKHRTNATGLRLFDPVFSKDQIEELSKKTKNAIVYSEPTTINEWLNADFFKVLSTSFLGASKKPNKRKKTHFHLKWKAFYTSNRFSEWQKQVPIHEINEEIQLDVKLDLVQSKRQKVVLGVDFNLNESSLKKKIFIIDLLNSQLNSFNIIVVHPAVKTNTAKSHFETLNDKYKNVEFIGFSEFKKIM
ncbi:hypothetical protein CW751_04105 [Brumimicrobium salinarum]|uniref:DUF3037 domain-containing protein n=1 Tax=Brumimicrobium salinarum TaxID=2058658 RepID=A0A2I0R563_9FLAO|nr:hypothetical protein [Brumimicrobium salinarum]PKR81718.1 hypothetical protein CW751_04105 [Brumimicrobium salinarum]